MTVVLVLGIAAAMRVAAPSAAADEHTEDPCRDCEIDVTPAPDGLLGSVRSEIAELNSHRSNPIPCHGTDQADGDGTESIGEFDGFWRWALTHNGNESWHEVNETDVETGTYFRREC